MASLPFRDDLERIRFSPYYSRLAAVTQVVSQHAAGGVVHNRLTHTLKVTAGRRAIATGLQHGSHGGLLERLGGCDPVVVQAAASAHDLGHRLFRASATLDDGPRAVWASRTGSRATPRRSASSPSWTSNT